MARTTTAVCRAGQPSQREGVLLMPACGTAVSSRPDPVHQFDLSGQIALVTGSSRGIGRTLAGGLAAAGASVVLNGLDPIRLDETRGELRARYGEDRIYASPFDI